MNTSSYADPNIRVTLHSPILSYVVTILPIIYRLGECEDSSASCHTSTVMGTDVYMAPEVPVHVLIREVPKILDSREY